MPLVHPNLNWRRKPKTLPPPLLPPPPPSSPQSLVSDSTTTTQYPTTATARTLNIPELLEAILLFTLSDDSQETNCRLANRLRRVCKSWMYMIDSRRTFRTYAFRDPTLLDRTNADQVVFCNAYLSVLNRSLHTVKQLKRFRKEISGLSGFTKVLNRNGGNGGNKNKNKSSSRFTIPSIRWGAATTNLSSSSAIFLTQPVTTLLFLRFTGRYYKDSAHNLTTEARSDFNHDHFITNAKGIRASDLVGALREGVESLYRYRKDDVRFEVTEISLWTDGEFKESEMVTIWRARSKVRAVARKVRKSKASRLLVTGLGHMLEIKGLNIVYYILAYGLAFPVMFTYILLEMLAREIPGYLRTRIHVPLVKLWRSLLAWFRERRARVKGQRRVGEGGNRFELE